MLTTIQPVPTTIPQRSKTQPAAYKPPPQQDPKFPPYNINPAVESTTDGGGRNDVFEGSVTVGGYAFPYSTIWLADGIHPGYFTNVGQSNGKGHYAFQLQVGYGSTTVQVFAENSVQNYSNIGMVTVNRGNPIEAWDSVALQAIADQGTPAAEAARDLAIVHAAQYDAIAAVMKPGEAYQVHTSAPKGASALAAADSAAFTTLTALFPKDYSLFESAEKSSFDGLLKTKSTTDGLAVGQTVGLGTLANRATDGSVAAQTLNPSIVPGLWRPTAPSFAPAVDPQFAMVKPFEIAGPSAFRPAAPPAVGTPAYDQALAEVSGLGRLDSTLRTADQTAAVQFWGGGNDAMTDPALWNAIAEQFSLARNDSLLGDARLFAELDFALADSGIATADSQVGYEEWRPISAVQAVDPTFQPLAMTPASPSYVSDHAAYSASAATVLDATFGARTKFTDASVSNPSLPSTFRGLVPTPPEPRTFGGFDQAAAEDGRSGIWGGVNFSFDVQAGATLGGQVGRAVLAGFPKGK